MLQNFHEIFKYFKEKYFIVHPYLQRLPRTVPLQFSVCFRHTPFIKRQDHTNLCMCV